MESTNELFGKVLSADSHLVNLKGNMGGLSLRGRETNLISLFAQSGKIISIVPQMVGNGPNFIVCEKLPDANISLPDDEWGIVDGHLRVPGFPTIDLKNTNKFDSYEKSEVSDFPGHMEKAIAFVVRKDISKSETELKIRLLRLAKVLKQYDVESVEIPIIDLLGFGDDKFKIGDVAICAMLLTARSFVAGKRFKIGWYNRFIMEIRRFLHRTNAVGKNWIEYALEGRTTETQQHFFKAMVEDFEYKDEMAVKVVEKSHVYNGRAFLIGANAVLEMIRERFL